MPVSEAALALVAKAYGAIGGAVVAVITLPPRRRGEAYRRFAASVITGFVCASAAVVYFDLPTDRDTLAGIAFLVAFSAWPAATAWTRFVNRWKGPAS